MHIAAKTLKPLSTVTLSSDENKMISLLRAAKWEPQKDMRDPISYKTKIPEFYSGVRLYKMQAGGVSAGGAMGALEVLVKKLEFNGIIGKQEMYPLVIQNGARFLLLKKADMDNLGVGKAHDDEDGE